MLRGGCTRERAMTLVAEEDRQANAVAPSCPYFLTSSRSSESNGGDTSPGPCVVRFSSKFCLAESALFQRALVRGGRTAHVLHHPASPRTQAFKLLQVFNGKNTNIHRGSRAWCSAQQQQTSSMLVDGSSGVLCVRKRFAAPQPL